MSAAAAICVLVPARGEAMFLGAALDSLRAQGFSDWHALVCPVGEAALAVASRHIADDSRIRALAAQANEIESMAQASAGIEAPFVCVLDGDDALEPDALAALHSALASAPQAGMAYSRHVLVDANGSVVAPGPLCELPYSPEALLLDFMTGPLRLMRTQAFRDAGGFDAACIDAADYDLCLRLSETTEVVHVPRPLYRRRIHPLAPEVARWAEAIEARYLSFVAAVQRRGLDAQYDCALEIDSWHILQPLRPFGGVGNWR